nr:CASP-like protein 5C3 [Ipomoea batatas]
MRVVQAMSSVAGLLFLFSGEGFRQYPSFWYLALSSYNLIMVFSFCYKSGCGLIKALCVFLPNKGLQGVRGRRPPSGARAISEILLWKGQNSNIVRRPTGQRPDCLYVFVQHPDYQPTTVLTIIIVDLIFAFSSLAASCSTISSTKLLFPLMTSPVAKYYASDITSQLLRTLQSNAP